MKFIKEKTIVVEEKLDYEVEKGDLLEKQIPKFLDLTGDWTDIKFNGLDKLIFETVNNGKKEIIIDNKQIDELNNHIKLISNRAGKNLNNDNPEIDTDIIIETAEKKIKFRYALVFSKVTNTKYDSFCIRKNHVFTLNDDQLNQMVKHNDQKFKKNNGEIIEKKNEKTLIQILNEIFTENKVSVIISGETGSGKTELQKKMIEYIHPAMSIVSVQDTNDVALKELYQDKDVVEFFQIKNFDMTESLKTCLRFNPDYIIVSEIRGKEVEQFLESLQTGHAGITTIHAKSARSTAERMADLYNKYNSTKPITEQKVKSLVDYIIHIEVDYVNESGKYKKKE